MNMMYRRISRLLIGTLAICILATLVSSWMYSRDILETIEPTLAFQLVGLGVAFVLLCRWAARKLTAGSY